MELMAISENSDDTRTKPSVQWPPYIATHIQMYFYYALSSSRIYQDVSHSHSLSFSLNKSWTWTTHRTLHWSGSLISSLFFSLGSFNVSVLILMSIHCICILHGAHTCITSYQIDYIPLKTHINTNEYL